jgi:hypothetical protein
MCGKTLFIMSTLTDYQVKDALGKDSVLAARRAELFPDQGANMLQ